MNKIKRFFRKTIVVDLNLLPKDYKSSNGTVSAEDIKRYENNFNINIIPLDSSARNTKGSTNFYIKKI